MTVILRPWQKSDRHVLAQMCNNKNIWDNLRDIMPLPYTLKDAEEWIRFNKPLQPARNFCVEADGTVVGGAGLVIHTDIFQKNVEIGYYVAQEHWGKGIATETVCLLTNHIFTTLDCIRLYAEVFAHNIASMRVLEKNGFHQEAIHEKSIYKNGQLIDGYWWVKFNPNHPFLQIDINGTI